MPYRRTRKYSAERLRAIREGKARAQRAHFRTYRVALPQLRCRQRADYADLSALRAEDGGNVLMSDAMNLPPLPLRYDLVTRANPETGGYRDVPVYSADDMRAYGEACAAAERKAWMKAIHSAGVDWLAERAIRARGKT